MTDHKGTVVAKRNPWSVVKERTGQQVLRILTEFGLTPSSRTRVQALPEEENDPITEMLKARESRN